ncbi:MAG: sigma-54-dependent Fis family transcriptional regulator, partial [Acidobacteria bacterium]|nr:sigma-54-dependent Fis family transcriptional regulator [Acidobacteriota bacterium]
ATVLVEGETGTGKELVARALHAEGSRRSRPFVAVNCAAIPESLLESELFGHERGAFTGAAARYLGRVETAEGGTLFLDEVGEMPLAVQAKLLRFLQSGEVVRLGGGTPRRVDVRVVAAASKPLKDLVAKGLILDALYYRLNVVPLSLPPLRERGEDDIRLLATHFLERWAGIYRRAVAFDPETLALLTAHTYPGNVRELENLVHRLVALARGPLILPGDLPEELHRPFPTPATVALRDEAPASLSALEARRRQSRHLFSLWETRLAERAVEEAGGSVSEAAQRLGVHRATLHRMLRRGEDS